MTGSYEIFGVSDGFRWHMRAAVKVRVPKLPVKVPLHLYLIRKPCP